MNYSKIFLFLGLTFGLGMLSLYLPALLLEDGSILEPLLKLLFYCWTPAAAAIITQKYMYKGSMARYGWNRKHFSFSWIALALFLPIGIIAGTIAMVFVLGNVMRLPGFGEVIMGQGWQAIELFQHSLSVEMGVTGGLIGDFLYQAASLVRVQMPPEMWAIFTLILVVGIIGGTTVNLLFNVGEEVGWRGFMLVETKSLGFMGSNFIIGTLWGLWYVPLLFDLSSMNAAVMSDIFALVGYSVSLSFLMAYLSVKTRSIYASATFHGVLNNIAILSMFFIWGENPLIGSVKGLAGMFVFLGLTFLIIRFDKAFVDSYRESVY